MFSFLLEICLEVELMDHMVTIGSSQVVREVKNLPANAGEEMQVQSWDPLEESMAAHSTILAWRIPWTEEPGKLQSMGLQSQT